MMSSLLKIGKDWFAERKWKAFPFQLETWQAYLDGHHDGGRGCQIFARLADEGRLPEKTDACVVR